MNLLRFVQCDLKRVGKDRGAVVWLVLLPLLFAFVFGNAFGPRGEQTTWIPIIDLDRSEISGLFIEAVRGPGFYVETKDASNLVQLREKWPYGVILPADFSERLLDGEKCELTVVQGDGSSEKLLHARARLLHATILFTKALALADVSRQPWNDDRRQCLKEILERPNLLTISRQTHRSLRPPPSGFYQSLPGMLVMLVLQMILIYGSVTLIHDRVGGRLSRMIASPVRRADIYVGKVLARVIVAMIQAALVLVGGSLLFRIPLGEHPWWLAPVVGALALFAGSLSILAGLLCRTEKQAIQTSIFVAMILSALGGCWWPIEVVPDSFQTIAHFTPSYWAVHGIQQVLYFGKSHEVLRWNCLILLAFTAVVIGVATWVARRRSII